MICLTALRCWLRITLWVIDAEHRVRSSIVTTIAARWYIQGGQILETTLEFLCESLLFASIVCLVLFCVAVWFTLLNFFGAFNFGRALFSQFYGVASGGHSRRLGFFCAVCLAVILPWRVWASAVGFQRYLFYIRG